MIKAKIIMIEKRDNHETIVELNVECLEITLGENMETITLNKCKVN